MAYESPYAYNNPYTPSAVTSLLPVPLQCETTYLVMQNFGGTNNVSVKLDKQIFNHSDFFHKMGCYPYHNKAFNDRSGTGSMLSTTLDGSSYLLNNDDIEAHLSIKAQGIFKACGSEVKSVTFHYVANWHQATPTAQHKEEVKLTPDVATFVESTANLERVIVRPSSLTGAPQAFTQMIVCNPPAILTGANMTTNTDALVQNTLIGFFAIPPLNTSEVTAFTATYVFTPLPAKK